MLDLSFQDLFVRVASLFVGDEMGEEDLRAIVDASFATFLHKEVVPVVLVEDVYVAELFHGPTYAFKDFGQQVCRIPRGFLLSSLSLEGKKLRAQHPPSLTITVLPTATVRVTLWRSSTQVLCRMIDFFACKNCKPALLIVSTTGDTGPAAIRAVEGCSRLSIICFYPHGQVSELQERQVWPKPWGPTCHAVNTCLL